MTKARMRRLAMRGWLKWTIPLFAVFSVLFADAWLNTELRNHDYEKSRLRARLDDMETQSADVDIAKARLETLDRLDEIAPGLGLQEPQPEQIKVVRVNGPLGEYGNDDAPFALARLDATPGDPLGLPRVEHAAPMPAVVEGLSVAGDALIDKFGERLRGAIRASSNQRDTTEARLEEGGLAPMPAPVRGIAAAGGALVEHVRAAGGASPDAQVQPAGVNAPELSSNTGFVEDGQDSAALDASLNSLLGEL